AAEPAEPADMPAVEDALRAEATAAVPAVVPAPPQDPGLVTPPSPRATPVSPSRPKASRNVHPSPELVEALSLWLEIRLRDFIPRGFGHTAYWQDDSRLPTIVRELLEMARNSNA